MKLGLVVAVWGRPKVTFFGLRRVARAAAYADVRLVAVTDEWENGRVARALGYEVVSHPNTFLSNKYNAGAEALRDQVDALVVWGSDNWCTDNFFTEWSPVAEAHAHAGLYDSWQLCIQTGRARYFAGYGRHGSSFSATVGVGRTIRREVLDALDWQPWYRNKRKRLDHAMVQKMRDRGFVCNKNSAVHQNDLSIRMAGLKDRFALNPYRNNHNPRMHSSDAAELLAPFPQDEVREMAEAFPEVGRALTGVR